MSIFSVRNLSVSYKDIEVVKNINFSIDKGEFCALLGLNGAGKTTVLNACCGFIKAEGECAVSGQKTSVLNEKERAKLISYIPQKNSNMEGKSVLDVVLMGFNPVLNVWRQPTSEQQKKATEVLNNLNCGDLIFKDFGELSQGQQQLVVLARSIVQNTPVMLMDEPDSSLDFLNRHMILKTIADLIHNEKKAGLITLHDPNFAMTYCDRLFLLKDKRISEEIFMHNSTSDEIQKKLSTIYGNIDVIKHNDSFVMLRK